MLLPRWAGGTSTPKPEALAARNRPSVHSTSIMRALYTALTLLIGAFIASVSAAIGG
jgi:hypothetical protein